ncbi:ABC transporter ATP-binding protein [Limnochorda pilosa]|uniref:Branched-chain amino acid ABC transporter ATP-binding protein n=1 Tax=Limnochorda pilosa TaxID=1555112 RepID=A0A0K2SJN4_LIMPI|nr:ABC transporter ATP-binding protein [Limnochorda pilosa]BAS27217.1 branched-chain amino acid ABC transporter ATP-binding protein [Limnochorda pilosa]
MLQCQQIHRSFGGLKALSAVDLSVEAGEIVGLIGPNGSGKTTLTNVVTGFYPPQEGRVLLSGQDVTGWRPHRVARLGVARTFQNLALFRGLSALENILLGRHVHTRAGVLSAALYWWWGRTEETRQRRVVEEVIDFLQLEAVRDEPVELLPLGLQKRVELARALAAEPRLLILDEPMAGMNQEEKEYMARFILDTREERGAAILLIEHHMDVVMGVCDRVAVLDHGVKIADGPPPRVGGAPAVIAAYLGEADHAS